MRWPLANGHRGLTSEKSRCDIVLQLLRLCSPRTTNDDDHLVLYFSYYINIIITRHPPAPSPAAAGAGARYNDNALLHFCTFHNLLLRSLTITLRLTHSLTRSGQLANHSTFRIITIIRRNHCTHCSQNTPSRGQRSSFIVHRISYLFTRILLYARTYSCRCSSQSVGHLPRASIDVK